MSVQYFWCMRNTVVYPNSVVHSVYCILLSCDVIPAVPAVSLLLQYDSLSYLLSHCLTIRAGVAPGISQQVWLWIIVSELWRKCFLPAFWIVWRPAILYIYMCVCECERIFVPLTACDNAVSCIVFSWEANMTWVTSWSMPIVYPWSLTTALA